MRKNILIAILLLTLPSICFSQDATLQITKGTSKVNNEFINTLVEKRIENISIMVPGYLIEKKVSKGKGFQDISNGKRAVAVLIDNAPLENNLKNAVSNKYEFWEKTYYPGTDTILIILSKMYKSGFQTIEKMERVDLRDFRGFVTKGIRNTTKGDFYIFDYILFHKGDDQRQINVAIQSTKDYFLSDNEGRYIISTLKIIN